jgi:hypothetical protein
MPIHLQGLTCRWLRRTDEEAGAQRSASRRSREAEGVAHVKELRGSQSVERRRRRDPLSQRSERSVRLAAAPVRRSQRSPRRFLQREGEREREAEVYVFMNYSFDLGTCQEKLVILDIRDEIFVCWVPVLPIPIENDE